MVMLSHLRRFNLSDEKGRLAKLRDLSVALLDGDYPPVISLYFRRDDKTHSLPWDAVKDIDFKQRLIKVNTLDESVVESADSLAKAILLGAGILDALVLDLQNRRATRANDLWLEYENNQLVLRSADTSFRSILRRISGGRYGGSSEKGLCDWKYVEYLGGNPEAAKSEAGQHLRISHLPPGEIARLTDALPYLHAAELITLLADPTAADTLEAMTPERQLQVFEELHEDQALRLLTLMAPDIATDLIARLQTPAMRRYLERLPRKQAERIIELLRYPENTVGSIMTNDVVYAVGALTVREARERLREPLKEPDFVHLIYIVDGEEVRRLRGVISLRALLTNGEDERLEDLMDPYVMTVQALDSADEAAYRVLGSHMAALPVVGSNQELLGILTVDAAVSQVAPESWNRQAPRIFS